MADTLFADVARLSKMKPKPSTIIADPDFVAPFIAQIKRARERQLARDSQHERALRDSEEAREKREKIRQERSRR